MSPTIMKHRPVTKNEQSEELQYSYVYYVPKYAKIFGSRMTPAEFYVSSDGLIHF